jgi:non-specific serine/threonine protein kinase
MFDPRAGAGTYYLLQTVNQYARERLNEAQESAAFRQRHLEYMLSIAERQLPEAFDPAHGRLLRRDQENLRAALCWAVAEANAEMGLRLATAMFPLWFFSGHYAEGRTWYERLLALPAAPAPIMARAKVWLGLIEMRQGNTARADAVLQEALEQHREYGDATGAALALLMLANMVLCQGDLLRAQGLFGEASAFLRALASPAEITALYLSAVIARELGELERAEALAEECEKRQRNYHNASGYVVYLKGLVAASRGDARLAAELFTEARDVGIAQEELNLVSDAERELGHVQLDQGMSEQAVASFSQAVELAYGSGDLNRLARSIEGLAGCIAGAHPTSAVRLAGAGHGMRGALQAVALPSDECRLRSWLQTAKKRVKGTYMATWDAGHEMNADETVALARIVGQKAEVQVRRPVRLTPRERDVLRSLARARTNLQIAAELNISPETVRTHIDHILGKLGLHSRAQVAVWANKHEL